MLISYKIENIYLKNFKKRKIMTIKFKEHIENLFKSSDKFSDNDKNLDISKILESIEKIDADLITLLLNDEKAKERFFLHVKGVYVLEQNRLIEFFTQNDYMKNGSYTSYTNKIGLIKKDSFIKKFDDVVLAWPHKDCILEGGQTKDEDKNKETFYNEILNSDECERLFEPKVLTNIKRYSKEGVEKNPSIKEDDNFIIKGNNLLALHSLKKKYAGKVKLIYIDPPYNTGNDSFKYNDNFNHSTWLTFMKNRLEVAREFLSDDGNIFIQIDDFEDSYLKVLMDEVFGVGCFRNKITWKRRGGSANPLNRLNNVVDYILWYSNSELGFQFFTPFSKDDENTRKYIKERFINKDTNGRKFMKSPLQSPNPRPNLMYNYKNYKTPKNGWSISKAKMEEWDKLGKLCFPEDKEKNINRKIYLDEYKGQPVSSLWTDISVINPMSSERGIFESGQKPENLLKRIIEMSTNSTDLVMDFHLGSGTTCAVAHKMGRRYIGIEQMDYIEDIAVQRMKKVCEGEQGGISKAVKWSGGGEFIYAELKEIDTFAKSEIGKLNKTMKYLPISELEDEEYKISKEEVAINKAFYGLENE